MSPLLSEMHADWAQYLRLNITWDMRGNQTETGEQSFNAQLYRLEIELNRCVNSSCAGVPS